MTPAPDHLDLRDIHLPPEPSWWPPAPGWWLLAVLVAAAAFLLLRHVRRFARARRWRRDVMAELERITTSHSTKSDPTLLAADVSQLLRRISRLLDPRAVALRDEAWLDFLDARLPPGRRAGAPFRRGPGRALIEAPYRRTDDPAAAFDAQALLELAREWIVQALPGSPAHV